MMECSRSKDLPLRLRSILLQKATADRKTLALRENYKPFCDEVAAGKTKVPSLKFLAVNVLAKRYHRDMGEQIRKTLPVELVDVVQLEAEKFPTPLKPIPARFLRFWRA